MCKDWKRRFHFLSKVVNSATEIGKDQPLLVIPELTQLFPRPTSACLPACQMLTNESENQVTQRTLGCRHNTLTPTKRIILIHHFSFFWWSKIRKAGNVLMGWEYIESCWYKHPKKKAESKLITGQRKNAPRKSPLQGIFTPGPAKVVISGHWQGLDPGPWNHFWSSDCEKQKPPKLLKFRPLQPFLDPQPFGPPKISLVLWIGRRGLWLQGRGFRPRCTLEELVNLSTPPDVVPPTCSQPDRLNHWAWTLSQKIERRKQTQDFSFSSQEEVCLEQRFGDGHHYEQE